MTDPTTAQIAGKLTGAQRRAMVAMPDRNLDRWCRRVRWQTYMVLRRHGLLATVPLRPTEAGLAVRTYLMENSDG